MKIKEQFEQENMSQTMKDRFRGFLPVIVDVETGGFDPKTNALLEVAMITTTFDEQGKLIIDESIHFDVVPAEGTEVAQEALDFTGIVLDENRNATDEKEALQESFQVVRQAIKRHGCSRAVLVGHNAWFDLHFVHAAAQRQGIKRNPFHQFTSFDTATLAGVHFGHTVLAEACKRAEIDFDNDQAHSALYDTTKTAELFCKIINQI